MVIQSVQLKRNQVLLRQYHYVILLKLIITLNRIIQTLYMNVFSIRKQSTAKMNIEVATTNTTVQLVETIYRNRKYYNFSCVILFVIL